MNAATAALGLLPWPAAYAGAYLLHSAIGAFALYHALCLLAGLYHARAHGLRRIRPVDIRVWLALGAAGLAACTGAYAMIASPRYGARFTDASLIAHAIARLHLATDPLALIVLSCYFAIVNPAVEELFWRGAVYVRFIDGGYRPKAAAVLSGLLFGSWHWLVIRLLFKPDATPLAIFVIAAGGYFFAQLYERSGSIALTAFAHALIGDAPALIALDVAVLHH